MTDQPNKTLNASREIPARSFNGYLMLFVMLASMAAFAWGVLSAISAGSAANVVAMGFSTAIFLFVSIGFYMLQPNQGVALTLFGAYKGTDRNEGLRWVWPWIGKAKVSLRANNLISEKIKVNDLRGNHDQVGGELRLELMERLRVAGITVDECGFTHLAYAQEIAGAMLRRQQAEAVVAARKTLVEGAVGMVEMALEMLSAKNVVELDDERRAAMVSNLMVVLCGERDTQPVVNTGTLYS